MSESQSEIEEAFSQCLNIIDNPPAEHRIAKHAIQGAILLSIHRKDLISKIYFKLLQVVKDSQTYRLNPRVCAVREISYLTYHDEQLAPPAIQFLQSLLPCDDFNSQQISRAAVASLSRIARMHVVYQPNVIQTIRQIYQNSSKKSLRAEALIGIARMAQRNHSLRTEFASEFIKGAYDKNDHTKCAALSALGHAVVALENVPRDEGLEQRCFEICSNLLRTPRNQDYARHDSDWHLVHLCAIKALALLVRAAPATWWTPVAQVFERVLADPHEPWLSKCGAVWMSGKVSALFSSECQDYQLTRHVLLEAAKHDHTALVEAAVHGLVHLALAHDEQYRETRDLIKTKLGPSFKHTSGLNLSIYLRPWCKLIARAVNPLFQSIAARSGRVMGAAFSSRITITPPERVDEDVRRSVREPEPVVEKTFKLDLRQVDQTVRPIARDDQQLWRVCSEFSASVLESLMAMLRDITLLDDQQLVQHIKLLILDYKNKVQHGRAAPDPALHLHYKELAQMDLLARETAVAILKFPHVLDDAAWLSSVKHRFAAPAQQHHAAFPAPYAPPQAGPAPMSGGFAPSGPHLAQPQPAPLPVGFNPAVPAPPQQQQQLLQLLALTNPALLMQLNQSQLNAQPHNALNPLALLHTLQQHAVLNALQQQSALTNPARDPRLGPHYPHQPSGPSAPHHVPEQPYHPSARGSYARGRGGHRGGRGGPATERGTHEQGHKRPRDDLHPGPDTKRAKINHPGGTAQPGPGSVNVPPGSRTGQSESGSATQPSFTELSSNSSPQTTTERVVSAPVSHVSLEPSFTEQLPIEARVSNDVDVVALGSDSDEELPLTRVTPSASDSEDSDDEEGEISSDASAPPGPDSASAQRKSDSTAGVATSERKKRKRKKKKKKPSEREVCKYFLNRSCTKGAECPYLHPADVKLEEVCRFYRSGVCRRGDECIYSHDLSREACKHMVQGTCLYGERCRFSHDAAVVEAQRRITPPSHKARARLADPPTAPLLPPMPISGAPLPALSLAAIPFMTQQQRDPRLDPTLSSNVAEPLTVPAPTPVQALSPDPPPFNLTLLTSSLTGAAPASKSSVADELKKLL